MSKLFLANVLRSLIFCAVAISVAIGLSLGVSYLFIKVFQWAPVPFWMFGVISIWISALVMLAVEKWGKESPLVFPEIMLSEDSYWIKRIENGKKIKWVSLRLSLLFHLAVGLVMIGLLVTQLPNLLELCDNPPENLLLNSGMYYMILLLTVMVVQLWFYFKYRSHYSEMKCDKCRHVFCLVKEGVDSVSKLHDIESYEDNKSHYVEFELDGHRYGGMAEGKFHSRIVTTNYTYYNCKCKICGNTQLHLENTGKEYGSWSE